MPPLFEPDFEALGITMILSAAHHEGTVIHYPVGRARTTAIILAT